MSTRIYLNPMDRREFLGKIFKRSAIGGGIAAVGAAGTLGYYQPRKEIYSEGEDADGLKERLDEPGKVVVVGGGLAGISAAMELARRNFDVTLVEASAEPGGKLTGWEVDALGTRFPVEHGFHGYFNQYYNLN
ncbi:MAG: FAD-dependent oxidoreductase, partial [Ignavibacteriaceae bacterium]|nr:FAD-dependent oxidoreductase [Ignavibacteriaceae bacterium]